MRAEIVLSVTVPDDTPLERLEVGNLFLWVRNQDGRTLRPLDSLNGNHEATLTAANPLPDEEPGCDI